MATRMLRNLVPGLLVLLSAGTGVMAETADQNDSVAVTTSAHRVFSYDSEFAALEHSAKKYVPLLESKRLTAGVYWLPAGAVDDQEPHDRDEVYYVAGGKGAFVVGDNSKRVEVSPRTVLFVRAGVPHHFTDISDGLKLVVLFSKAKTSPDDPPWLSFNVADGEISDLKQNIWDRFLSVSSLHLGLYRLPQALGGDRPLVHGVDEFNIVVKQTAHFQVEDDDLSLEPGAMVWVADGQHHHFHDLGGNFEVLIFFPQEPGVQTP